MATKTQAAAKSAQTTKPKPTKISNVISLLGRKEGATLDDLVKATGWQQHSTRAALTGLKKKGHVIEKSKRDDATCYRIINNS